MFNKEGPCFETKCVGPYTCMLHPRHQREFSGPTVTIPVQLISGTLISLNIKRQLFLLPS